MATANPTPALMGPSPGAARWLPLVTSALITGLFATLAFRLSFTALTALATEHGVRADAAWMFAALVDGGAVVGTVGVVTARWAGRRTWPYWLTVGAFAALSLGFNIAHSDGTSAGIAIAVTPPAAQLVATELLVRLLPMPSAGERPASHADECRARVPEVQAQAQAAGEAQASSRVAAAGPRPPMDLAAMMAADITPPVADPVGKTEVIGAELPVLAATFAAPPAPEARPVDEEDVREGPAPAEAVAAYRRIRQEAGKRPTAEEFGAALNVRRSRGGELRQLVEEELGYEASCAVTFP